MIRFEDFGYRFLLLVGLVPGDLAPVFDSILETAMRLCEAATATSISDDGKLFHHAAI